MAAQPFDFPTRFPVLETILPFLNAITCIWLKQSPFVQLLQVKPVRFLEVLLTYAFVTILLVRLSYVSPLGNVLGDNCIWPASDLYPVPAECLTIKGQGRFFHKQVLALRMAILQCFVWEKMIFYRYFYADPDYFL